MVDFNAAMRKIEEERAAADDAERVHQAFVAEKLAGLEEKIRQFLGGSNKQYLISREEGKLIVDVEHRGIAKIGVDADGHFTLVRPGGPGDMWRSSQDIIYSAQTDEALAENLVKFWIYND